MKSANQSWSSTTALQIPVQMKLYNSLAGEEVKKKKKKKKHKSQLFEKGLHLSQYIDKVLMSHPPSLKKRPLLSLRG